ncbi:hypothetical protein DFS34DRAFT_505565 [Phlyctochytrium arcticum]|nr:hypothetical protein DFS34DRAFT_505565 [Phlyctochytrium arcticum]
MAPSTPTSRSASFQSNGDYHDRHHSHHHTSSSHSHSRSTHHSDHHHHPQDSHDTATHNNPRNSSSSGTDDPNNNSGSRQYQTAQRLRHTIGTNKVWACDRCYRLKIKCDSARPSCAACIKHDLGASCMYGGSERTSSNTGRRGRRYDTAGYVRMLEARVREVEGLLQHKRPPDDDDSDDAMTPSPPMRAQSDGVPDTPIPHSATSTAAGPASAADPHPHLAYQPLPPPPPPFQHQQHHQEEYNHHPTSKKVRAAYRYTPPDGGVQPTPHPGLFHPEVLNDLVQTFFEEVQPAWFASPLVRETFAHRPYFERPDHSQLLINSMCATAAPYSSNPAILSYLSYNNLPAYRAGEPFYDRGLLMINDSSHTASIEAVVATVLLAASVTAMGKDGSLRRHLLGCALRAADMIRLSVDPDVEEVHGVIPWYAKEVRRRVWWLVCSVDVIHAHPGSEGKEPEVSICLQSISDRTPWLAGWVQTPRAPAPDALFHSLTKETGLPRLSAFVPGVDFDSTDAMVRLTRLYAKIKQVRGPAWNLAERVTRIKSPDTSIPDPIQQSQHPSRAEAIHQLSQELSDWLQSLPSWAQNITQAADFTPSTTSRDPLPWQLFCLHLFHNAAHISLHLPTLLDHPPSSQTSTACSICTAHARNSGTLLRRSVVINPSSNYFGPWPGFYIFVSCLVLIIASKMSRDPAERASIQADIDAHVSTLRGIAQRWFSATQILRILGAVIEDGDGIEIEIEDSGLLKGEPIGLPP